MRVVVAHQNADLDALASLVAACRLYDDAVAVGGTSNSPSVQRYLALHKDRFPLVSPREIDPQTVEELILVDVRDRRRLRDIEHILQAGPRIGVWDHHPETEWDVPADELNAEPVGACVTLLVERLREKGCEIPPEEATLYLLGLYADTGRLSYATTRPRDVTVAAHLLERGAQLKVVNRYLRHTLDADQSRLLVELLASAEEMSIERVEVAIAAASVPDVVRGAATVVQQVMELGGHDAIFGAIRFERNGRVQLIGRSRVSYVDVGKILSEFGGGGHRGAGAASIKGEELQRVVDRLKSALVSTPLEPTRVADIMTAPIHFLEHDDTLEVAGQHLAAWGISGAPVRRDGQLVGILSRRDIRRAELTDSLHLPVSSHMAHQVTCVDHQEPIEDALELMTLSDVGRMPVTRGADLIGIVTRTDLIKLLYMKMPDESDIIEVPGA